MTKTFKRSIDTCGTKHMDTLW